MREKKVKVDSNRVHTLIINSLDDLDEGSFTTIKLARKLFRKSSSVPARATLAVLCAVFIERLWLNTHPGLDDLTFSDTANLDKEEL